MSIGRHAKNTLMLIDSKASSYHAEIVAKPDGYVIKDLGSTNGVFVNGKRVTKKTLQSGDVIKIGLTTISAE
jgi:adenylate cyclase